MGYQIAAYFEELQVDPGGAESPISAGYAVPQPAPGVQSPSPTVLRQIAASTPAVVKLAQHHKQ